jgi:hypothetical protein
VSPKNITARPTSAKLLWVAAQQILPRHYLN